MAVATPARLSFALDAPRGMLAKLEREIARVVSASHSRDGISDHGINAAITAWLLVDWCWKAKFESDVSAQDLLVAPTSPSRTKPDANRGMPPMWFKRFLWQQCPELSLCQDVANGSKHMTVDFYPADVVETTASATISAPSSLLSNSVRGTANVDGSGRETTTTTYRLKIRDAAGDNRPAVDVFTVAKDFWAKFLLAQGLA